MRINASLAIPLRELEIRASRSSGPGGQHANVTASRIEVVFEIASSPTLGEDLRRLLEARLGPRVTAVAQDSRSQAQNRELALERLRARLAAALVPSRPRRPTRPTRASQRRRLDGKRRAALRKRSRRARFDPDDT